MLHSYLPTTILHYPHTPFIYRRGGDHLGVGQVPHIQGADRGRPAEPGAERETGLVSIRGCMGVYSLHVYCICGSV